MKIRKDQSLLCKREGVIMIEVLCAVVILAVCLTMIIRSLLIGVEALVIAKDYMQATMLIDEKMFDLMKKSLSQELLAQEGSFDRPGKDYRYFLEIDNLPADYPAENMNEVKLSVSWPSGRNRREVSVATFLFNEP